MSKRARRKRRALMRAAERKYATHPKHYLAYGSNHNLEQMGWRCPDAKTVCRAYLEDWKLVFSGVLTIEKAEGYSVPLSVWKVTGQDIQALDRYEGYPHLYGKIYLDVKTPDGKSHPAFTYVLEKPYGIYPPTRTYYRDVEEGYTSWGFDKEPLITAYNEAAEHSDYPYSYGRYRRSSFKPVVESYYQECDVCHSWVPYDELVRDKDNLYVCYDCMLRHSENEDSNSFWYGSGPHADEDWWVTRLKENWDA